MRNYVYAVYKWALDMINVLPHYTWRGATGGADGKGYRYSYDLLVPMSNCTFCGYGNTRNEARQMAAKSAFKYFDIDPNYLDIPKTKTIYPNAVYVEAQKILPDFVICKIEKSSGVYYLHGADMGHNDISYVYDVTAGDIRCLLINDLETIGCPRLEYVEGMGDYVLEQYSAGKILLPDIYAKVYESLKQEQTVRRYNLKNHKIMKYVDRYIVDMQIVLDALGNAILTSAGTSGSKRRIIIDYMQAHGYNYVREGWAYHYKREKPETENYL